MNKQIKNMVGLVFGDLTVLNFSHTDSNRDACWNVRCKCGKEKIISGNRLRTGGAVTCGCSRRGRKGERGFNVLYAKYRCKANRMKIPFTLSKEYFRMLVTSNCYYCGVEPLQKVYSLTKEFSEEYLENCQFIYNGIDRINHKDGYTRSNSVPCCKICNYRKATASVTDFINWIHRASDYLSSKKLEGSTICGLA